MPTQREIMDRALRMRRAYLSRQQERNRMPWYYDQTQNRWTWADYQGTSLVTATNSTIYWTSATSTAASTSLWYPGTYTNQTQSPSLQQWRQYRIDAQIAQIRVIERPLAAPAIIQERNEHLRQRLLEEGWEEMQHRPRRDPLPPSQDRIERLMKADKRAVELLMSHLDEQQLIEFNEKKSFTVEGASGQKYRIECAHSYSINIHVIGKRHKLCAHLGSEIPSADHFLAQKLMLEHDESRFLRLANRHAA